MLQANTSQAAAQTAQTQAASKADNISLTQAASGSKRKRDEDPLPVDRHKASINATEFISNLVSCHWYWESDTEHSRVTQQSKD